MSKEIWNFLVWVLMISKTAIAIPLEFDDDELSEFDMTDPENSEIPLGIDDTIDIFSIDQEPDGTEEALSPCENSDCEVQLNAEEIQDNDFNSGTSQEDLPNETESELIEEPAEIKQKEITNEQKSKNNEILSKIETAILKSQSNNDDFNNIVTPVPEFVPIFKPRGSGDVNKKCDAKNNLKVQTTTPAAERPNPKVNEDNNFVITGLYLKPLSDLNHDSINIFTKDRMQNAITNEYPTLANRLAHRNVNPDFSYGFPSGNQNQISSNNARPDIFTSIPNYNLGLLNLEIPTQKQNVALNPNQATKSTQTILCNTAPCSRTNVFNTQNKMSLQNAQLLTTDHLTTNHNVLLNPNSPYNPNLNTVISNQAKVCTDSVQPLNSNTLTANRVCPVYEKLPEANLNCANQMPCSNLNMNAGSQIQKQLIIPKNLAPEKVLSSNTLTPIRTKPLFFFKPETFTHHEVCGDYLKKKTYTVLVPFQVSKIA